MNRLSLTVDMASLLPRRVGAYLLDILVLFTVLAPLGFVAQGALGVAQPATPHAIYRTLILNFSIPAWTYFTVADWSRGGATLGKRILGLRTAPDGGGRLGWGQAFARTAVKMMPWEIAHASSFLLVPALGTFTVASGLGLGVSYALSFAYLIVVWRTNGRTSVHDRVAATHVERSR